MNVLPVITRELRAQARQPFTYWLRVLGLVAMIGAAGAFVLDRGLMPGDGGRLFAFLHATLLLSIWVLVPMSVRVPGLSLAKPPSAPPPVPLRSALVMATQGLIPVAWEHIRLRLY